MAIRREHTGGAALAQLQTVMTSVGPTIITIDPSDGWPTGTDGPFVIVIDSGLASEEKMLVQSRSGAELTIALRGYDDTTPQAHNSEAEVEHVFSAVEADEANEHVMATSGVHGLTALDPVIGQDALDTHAALSDNVHGSTPGDPLATQSWVQVAIDQALLVGEIKHVMADPAVADPDTPWLVMDGRQVDAGKYPDLAALLGDTYGGDGVITVGLPDARGLVLRGADVAGLVSGSDTVTLETENLPAHTHSVDPPAHKHTIDPPATSTGNSTQSVQLRVRKGDNIEPEPNQLNGVSAWTNNNSSWAASAGGAGGTTDTSGQYISTSNHDHNVNIAAFDSAETDIPAFDSGSTGAGNAVDIVPKHLPVLVVMYAGTVVT